jgi:hypothetical protein
MSMRRYVAIITMLAVFIAGATLALSMATRWVDHHPCWAPSTSGNQCQEEYREQQQQERERKESERNESPI